MLFIITMSYDYDAIVNEFWSAREQATHKNEIEEKRPHWVQAIQAAEALSSHCPMTPLLWIQYANILSTLVGSSIIEYQTLQLGLLEFPGSLLLQLRGLEIVPTTDQKDAIESAMKAVGLGSHRNDDLLVVQLYRKLVEITGDPQVFVRRSRCSMRQQNETLMAEFSSFVEAKDLSQESAEETRSAMEEGRMWEAKVLRQLAAHEDSVEAIYHAQGLPVIPLNDQGSVDWESVMNSKQLGMGLGSTDLSSAFIRYAKAAQRVRGQKGTFDPHDLAVAIFERGVAECPTSEALWLAYISDLRRFRNGVERISSVTERAARNCPYSLPLAQQRIYVMEDLAAASMVVIAPDELFKIARECLARKFLPSSAIRELYVAALTVIKRRILHILAGPDESAKSEKRTKNRKRHLRYDDEEPLNKKGSKQHHHSLDDSEREEVDDLLEDLKEAYEDIISLLELPYDKAWVMKDRAWSKALLIDPLDQALESEDRTNDSPIEYGTWDQTLAAHQPPIPDACRLFTDMYIWTCPVVSPRQVVAKLRNIRYLYNQTFDNKNIPNEVEHEHRSALSVIGQLWISWEKCFGSERSLVKAKQRVEGKATQIIKHELHVNAEEAQNTKRSKVEEDGNDSINESASKESFVTAKAVHPFTVKVEKLSPTTTDMELVESFRPRCGTIVHARVIRHKDGKSKGWALLQFESKDSVTKALELNNVLGIQGKTVLVERSHMPAAPLVPPGMHKVSAKGEGKVSKRNEKRKQRIAIA